MNTRKARQRARQTCSSQDVRIKEWNVNQGANDLHVKGQANNAPTTTHSLRSQSVHRLSDAALAGCRRRRWQRRANHVHDIATMLTKTRLRLAPTITARVTGACICRAWAGGFACMATAIKGCDIRACSRTGSP